MSKVVNIEVDNKVYAIVGIGNSFAIGLHKQIVTTSTNDKEDYTATYIIIMIPFVSLTIVRVKFPKL